MPHLKLHLLGPPQVDLDGVPCDLHSYKALALLAYLVVTHQPHSRAKLATLFWPEQNESRALAYLRHTLWTLRKTLGDDLLDSEQEVVCIQPDADLWLDVARFQAHLAACHRPNGREDEVFPDDLPELEAAIDLYRDDFLAGFTLRDSPAFDDWQFFEREALRQQVATVLQQLVAGYSALGDHAAAIPHARRWLALDPLHEPAHQQLMQLYGWSGQHAAALRQYKECVRILRAELDAPPDTATTQLFQTIQANRHITSPAPLPVAAATPAPNALVARPTAPVAVPALSMLEETRIVTVLCVGLTDLLEPHLAPHLEVTARRIMRLLQATRPLLERYQARVDQVLGDNFLAVFGATQMHEDDPERALRTAWELQALARQQGVRLSMGVHTGAVWLRSAPNKTEEINPSERQNSSVGEPHTLVMGAVVNLAARLQAQGEAGDILVSKTTYHQTHGSFEFQPIALTLRGIQKPLTAYLLIQPQRHPAKARGLEDLRAALVGRDFELSHLRHPLDEVRQGEGRLITLMGEAGVGKSRLIAEAKAASDVTDAQDTQAVDEAQSKIQNLKSQILWLEGRAQELATSSNYWPFIDLIQLYLGWRSQENEQPRAARLRTVLNQLITHGALTTTQGATLLPLLGRLLGLQPADESERYLDEVDPEQRRHETLCALRDFFIALAQTQPLVLVLEDLHWADTLSLDLVVLLMEALVEQPILLLCVYRPEQEHRVWQLGAIATSKCPERFTELHLRELTTHQSRALVTSLLANPDLPPAFYTFILAKSQGNPLFVEEMIHTLIEVGALYRVAGRWIAQSDLTALAIPDTLQNLILARLDRLSMPLRQVVQCAAVIGRTFSHSLLTALLSQDLPQALDLAATLQGLIERAFIYQERVTPEMGYAFRHVLVQEAVYSSLLPTDRQRLHQLVATTVERLYPTQALTQVSVLAYHWEQAVQPENAIRYWQQAGDRARLAYAHPEAIHCYGRVLDLLLAQGDYPQAARTYMKLGLTQQNATDFEAARRAFEEGFALWQKAGVRTEPTTPSQTMHLFYGEPQTLEPAWAGDEMSENVIRQLFSGLVDLTPDLGIVPDIAQSWHLLHDGRTYFFRLRKDVYWSDGVPLTAHDFAYAWRRVLDPANGWWTGQALYAIRGAKAWHTGAVTDPGSVGLYARDDYTLVVELETPTSYFLALLTMTMMLPVPRHRVEKEGQSWTQPGKLVTSGPFLLADWQPGKTMSLLYNPRYHGSRQGNLRAITLRFGGTPAAALQEYEAGQLDVLPLVDLPTHERDLVRRRHMEEYLLAPRLATIFLRLDFSRPPFADLRLRRALAQAVDRVKLAGEALHGYDFPASGMLPAGMPGYAPDSGLPYEPEQARQLLAAAGYPQGRGFPAITAWAWPGIAPVCAELSRQWQEQLGIDIQWQYFDWPEFTRIGSKGYPDLFLYGLTVAYPDPDDLLRLQYGGALSCWQNDEYARLLAEAGRIHDQQQRLRLYRQADRLLCSEAPVIPLLYERLHLLIKPRVRVLPTSALKWSFWKDVVLHG